MEKEEIKKYLEECNSPETIRKSKNIPEYLGAGLSNLQIAYDTTDHFTIICPKCKSDCVVTNIKTDKKIPIDFEDNKDNVTFVRAYCIKCNCFGQRKIYWNSYLHKGRSLRGRTNWKEEYLKLKNGKKNQNDNN